MKKTLIAFVVALGLLACGAAWAFQNVTPEIDAARTELAERTPVPVIPPAIDRLDRAGYYFEFTGVYWEYTAPGLHCLIEGTAITTVPPMACTIDFLNGFTRAQSSASFNVFRAYGAPLHVMEEVTAHLEASIVEEQSGVVDGWLYVIGANVIDSFLSIAIGEVTR